MRIGIAVVFGAAISTIVLSQLGESGRLQSNSVGVTSLLGNDTLQSGDRRFRPVAMAVLNEAANDSRVATKKGGTVISETVLTDYFQKYIYKIPASRSSQFPIRPLTPAEALFLEELFTNELGRAAEVTISQNGINGIVAPKDISVKSYELRAKAKARGTQLRQWYETGAREIGAGQ